MVCLLAELGWKIVGWLAGLRVSWMCQEKLQAIKNHREKFKCFWGQYRSRNEKAVGFCITNLDLG